MDEGTLVQIKEEALRSGSYATANTKAVEKHGWLWTIVGGHITNNTFHDRALHYCRSLATGHETTFFGYELNVVGASDG